MNKSQKIQVLSEFKEAQELKNMANKRYDELRKLVLEEFDPGKYGELMLMIEERAVKEYVVPARVDRIAKVVRL